MMLSDFAERLRIIREARSLSQADLAERIGVVRETVTKWENGTAVPRPKRLQEIYQALQMTEREFWEYTLSESGNDDQEEIELVEPNPAPYLTVEVDERHRAIRCPRCGSREHLEDEYARYCGDCGCPVYNLCTVDRDHINRPSARRCGRCGAQTWWSLSEEQFAALLDQLALGSTDSSAEE